MGHEHQGDVVHRRHVTFLHEWMGDEWNQSPHPVICGRRSAFEALARSSESCDFRPSGLQPETAEFTRDGGSQR